METTCPFRNGKCVEGKCPNFRWALQWNAMNTSGSGVATIGEPDSLVIQGPPIPGFDQKSREANLKVMREKACKPEP